MGDCVVFVCAQHDWKGDIAKFHDQIRRANAERLNLLKKSKAELHAWCAMGLQRDELACARLKAVAKVNHFKHALEEAEQEIQEHAQAAENAQKQAEKALEEFKRQRKKQKLEAETAVWMPKIQALTETLAAQGVQLGASLDQLDIMIGVRVVCRSV